MSAIEQPFSPRPAHDPPLRGLANAVARAVELGIRMHCESSPIHCVEEGSLREGMLPTDPSELYTWLQAAIRQAISEHEYSRHRRALGPHRRTARRA